MPAAASRMTVKNLLPLVFVMSTISVIWYTYVFHHLAYLLQLSMPAAEVNEAHFHRGCVEAVISQILTVLVLICYARAVLPDPGSVPEDPKWNPEGSQQDVHAPNLHELKLSTGQRRHCKWCGCWKPDRCHHCRICRRCVLKMDHHCPWIMNCVGYHNHKYFFLVVLYSALDCLFITISMAETIQRVETTPMPAQHRFLLVFAITISLFLGCLLTAFLCLHSWLAIHDTTTIEFCEKAMTKGNTSPYDRGLIQNMYTLFGPNPLLWFLPMSPPTGDGVKYRTCGLAEPKYLPIGLMPTQCTKDMTPKDEVEEGALAKREPEEDREPEWTGSRTEAAVA